MPIEHDPVRINRVASHAVPRAGDGHRQPLRSGQVDEITQLALRGVGIGGYRSRLRHSCAVQAAGIIRVARRDRLKDRFVAQPGIDNQIDRLAQEDQRQREAADDDSSNPPANSLFLHISYCSPAGANPFDVFSISVRRLL
jgi:hypothetical protein